MKRVWITRYGGLDTLEGWENAPPPLADGEVTVAVRAAGINFADLIAWKGIAKESLALLKKIPEKELKSLAKKMHKSGAWEPETFVDLCDRFREKDPGIPAYRVLAAIQEIEWRALAEHLLLNNG